MLISATHLKNVIKIHRNNYPILKKNQLFEEVPSMDLRNHHSDSDEGKESTKEPSIPIGSLPVTSLSMTKYLKNSILTMEKYQVLKQRKN